MAIYKPTDCSPFNGTFDISKNSSDLPIVFECKIDTSNSPVTGYSIEIYDSNNSLIFPPTSREQGPIKNNVTYLSDLRPYVTTNFQSLLPNLKNINSGLNGSYLEIPFYVETIDTTENSTVSRNQMSANSIPGLVEGQTYTWKITLYQGIKNGNDFPPVNEKVYDMTVASGTVIGSNEKRIQTALIDSDDKVVDNLVLLDKFIQPIQIDGLSGYAPSNPVTSWTGAVPTTFTMTRSLITGYDSTYGYVYPSTAEGNAFADGQIVPENANGFQIFKNGNDPSNLGATDMVEFIYDGEFNGKMTWKTSAAKPEQSYWEQTYLVDGDPGGVFYPLKGDGYNSFALTGSERIIFNKIQDSKVQYAGIYYGSPYNGIFEPHFSTKEISTNNKAPSGTYMLPAGTYTFKQDTSVEGFTGEQNLNFSTTKNNGVVSEWTKIRTTTNGILYTSKSNSQESLVYLTGTKFINNTETITLKIDQEVSADFLMWFSQNVNVSFYQVTVVWNRTSDAANWGTLSNKIVYCRRDGKNYEINTTTQVGEINKTPFKFVEEKPVRIFNTAKVTTTGGGERYNFDSNSCIFNIGSAISSILSVTNNSRVDITKDCVFEVGNNYIIYTSSSAIPSDLTISVKYIPFNIQDYTGIIFYNKQATSDLDTGIVYIRPSININKNMIFKEVTTTANPTWFNINYFNKDYNYITYAGESLHPSLKDKEFNPEIDKTRYQIKSFYKDSDYNPFSIYKNPEIVSTISGNVIKSDRFTNAITTRNFTVTSTYSQNSYIQWKSYQWILYDSAKRTVLEKTDEKYDGEITATFYGLDPQKYYILSLILQTNTGKIVEIDYVIYSDFTETPEQRDLADAEFDCDTLSMKASLKLVNTVLAPNADEYLSNGTNPTEDTVYYYNKDLDFYQKKSKLGYYETAASIKDGVLTINGQNSLDYSKVFENYAINSNTRTGSIQTSAEEVVLEGVFMFSDDYVGDVFSISRDDNSNATVSVSIPKVLEEVGNDGFVNLASDINKLKIKNGSYLKVVDENGALSNTNTWQDSEKYHNTSVWKKSNVAPIGNRINVANFKYAEVKNNNGTYNKDTYLNIAGPYNSYDEAEPLKNPMNPAGQKFSFMSSDGEDISGMCSNGPFYINQPDRLIWLDYEPYDKQVEVVQDADDSAGVTTDKQSVCVETPLKWDDNTIWKDGIYVTKGLEKTLIGQVFVNGTIVKSDYIEKSGVEYSNSGLTKQIQVAQRITERLPIANYEFAFRIFINTNNFSVDQLRSRCYVKDVSVPTDTYSYQFKVTNCSVEEPNVGEIKIGESITRNITFNSNLFALDESDISISGAQFTYKDNKITVFNPINHVTVVVKARQIAFPYSTIIALGTASPESGYISTGDTVTKIHITPNSGYRWDGKFTCNGATAVAKTDINELWVSKATQDVGITVTCVKDQPKLSAPQEVEVNGNILLFNSVENAEKYEIFAGTTSIGETTGISVAQEGTILTVDNAPAKQSGTEVTIE